MSSRRSIPFTATLVVAALTLAAREGRAQAASDSLQRRDPVTASAWKPRLRLGYAPETESTIGRRTGVFMVGAEWVQRGGRPAVRLDATYQSGSAHVDETRVPTLDGTPCDGCRTDYRGRTLGLVLDGKYEFGRRTVRPYVASGVGLFRTSAVWDRNFACTLSVGAMPGTCVRTPPQSSRGNDIRLGMHAGAGLAVRAGRAQLFGEWRLQTLHSSARGRDVMPPLVFGVRF